MDELKACPFCGEKLSAQPDLFSGGVRYFHENNCIHRLTELSDDFLELWQTRPLEDALESRVDFLEDKLQEIVNWADAYPLTVFPEPDFKKVRAALESAGISLDQISASNMRHVVAGVGNIAREALKGGE
ncbi:MAG: hypothetical protein ACYC36_15250 [Bellilinea sp.]